MIARTIGGSQIDVSPLVRYNVNSTPMFGGGTVGNVTTGARLTTPQPSTWSSAISGAFTALGSFFGASANVITTGQRQLGDTAREAIRSGATVGVRVVSEGNTTLRELGDNAEGISGDVRDSVVSYSATMIVGLILVGLILYVPMTGLKKAGG